MRGRAAPSTSGVAPGHPPGAARGVRSARSADHKSCCGEHRPRSRSALALGGRELRLLGRARKGSQRRSAGVDHLGDIIEVARADFALVLGRRIALSLSGELTLLELDVSTHLAVLVTAREIEHRVIERVKPRKGHELELVAHRAQLALELANLRIRQLLLPVE